MTTRPHEALFRSAFEPPAAAAALLRELLPPAISTAIAWETLADERGAFIDQGLPDRHNDLLFSAQLPAGEPGLAFLLLEHQSTADPAMPQRMLSYQSRIWDRLRRGAPRAQLPPIIAVVVSHAPDGWTVPRAFEELFDPAMLALAGLAALVPRFAMIVDDLAHRSNADLKGRSVPTFQKLALWLLRDARDPARLLANFDAWIPELSRTGPDHLHILMGYLFHVVDPMTQTALHVRMHVLGSSAEEIAMTAADALREEGCRKGRIDTLRDLLLYKFQALDAAHEARLKTAPPEVLDRYLRRLLSADSVDAVFAD
jgi:hypothetical protein